MSQTYTIHIKDLLVRGRLGLYKEERKLGADFLVNADFTFSGREVRSMQDTVDYARILNLFRVHLAQPAELLEQCLADLSEQVYREYPFLSESIIRIEKLHPPLAMRGRVGVTLHKSYST